MVHRLCGVVTLWFVAFAGGAAWSQADDDVSLEDLERAIRDPFPTNCEGLSGNLDGEFGAGTFRYFYDDGVVPRPYLLAVEARDPARVAEYRDEYAELLTALSTTFYGEYGTLLEMEEAKKPAVVLVFDSEASYNEIRTARPELELNGTDVTAGYFDSRRRRMFQWRQPGLWWVMLHEGTHQLVDFASKKYNAPASNERPWFQEGFADFMAWRMLIGPLAERHPDRARKEAFGRFLLGRLGTLKAARDADRLLPVRRLVDLSRFELSAAMDSAPSDDASGRFASQVYAEGFAFTFFLHDAKDGVYRDALAAYFRAEVEGKGGIDAMVGDGLLVGSEEELDDVEAEFREFISGHLLGDLLREVAGKRGG